jgi:hypothetical protein
LKWIVWDELYLGRSDLVESRTRIEKYGGRSYAIPYNISTPTASWLEVMESLKEDDVTTPTQKQANNASSDGNGRLLEQVEYDNT